MNSNVHYNFTTCGNEGRTGPTLDKCMKYYENQQSPIFTSNFNISVINGSQIFTIPVAGTYAITIAGAKGGDGVCPTSIGLKGAVIKGMLHFDKYELLRIMVGQQGRNTCFNNTAEVCRGQMPTDNCQIPVRFFSNLDGGTGGGGASMLQRVFKNDSLDNKPIVIAPGGGGACLFSCSNDTDSCPSNISLPDNELVPGAGGNFAPSDSKRDVDGFSLNESGEGGMDCTSGEEVAFSGVDGGFGGGGGACEGGGGGGGWIGGRGGFSRECDDDLNITYSFFYGESGMSYGNAYASTWTTVGNNGGHGYVSLLLLCNCTYQCVFEGSMYSCSCPDNSFKTQDGLDCYRTRKNTLSLLH